MQPADLIVRPFNAASLYDYQALSAFYNYAYPEEQTTSIGLRMGDGLRADKLICQRFVAEQNGIIKGIGCFEHWAEFYHPDKYLLHIIVDPNSQEQGIGSALYERTITELEKLQPQFVRAWVQRDRERSVRFAERCGFKKVKLKWNIVLDVQSSNAESFAAQVEVVRAEGIEVKLLSQLADEVDCNRKLYDLHVKTINSIETPDTVELPSFDDFVENKNQKAEEITFVAVHNNQYVGIWELENVSGRALFGGPMGVLEPYRRRNVALSLTVHAISYAKEQQYSILTAHTDEHNKAILTLAEKLGFTHLPPQLLFSKQSVS